MATPPSYGEKGKHGTIVFHECLVTNIFFERVFSDQFE